MLASRENSYSTAADRIPLTQTTNFFTVWAAASTMDGTIVSWRSRGGKTGSSERKSEVGWKEKDKEKT